MKLMPLTALKGFFATMLLLSICAVPAVAGVDHPSKLKFKTLEFRPPETERVVLKNGMVLHLLENHEIPLIEISAMVRIGSIFEPADKAGIAGLTGSVWRSGGTKTILPEELDEKLEFTGSIMETSIGADSGSISLSVLKKNLHEGLTLFADLIKNPSFDKKRFLIAKNRAIEGIKRENDEPREIVKREFTKKLMPNHPLGKFPTMETVKGISRQECIDFYSDHVGPKSFIIGISGDFDSTDMIARFENSFADFRPAEKKFPDFPPVPDKTAPGIYLVDKQLPQSSLRMGHVGISRKSPDYYSARVMNFVLGGGGFSSRLMAEIRSTRGLAYSVYSYYFGGARDKGTFILGGETKAQSTYEFIEVSREIIASVIDKGVTKEELELAKQSIINGFVFAFDKDSEIVSRYMWLDYFGLPSDYLKKFRDNISKVTLGDAKKAARKYLHPDGMIIFIVGDRDAIGEKLKSLGNVEIVKLGS